MSTFEATTHNTAAPPDAAAAAPTAATAAARGVPHTARRTPNRAKFSLLVLIGVYPLVTAISYAIGPFTAGWEIWLRGLLLTPIMVPAMVYGLIPFIQARFGRWLMA